MPPFTPTLARTQTHTYTHPTQTTLQSRVSGHLAVNKLQLIDFNSGQHPSEKHSRGSELNKLPPGTVLQSARVYPGGQDGLVAGIGVEVEGVARRPRLRKTDLKSAVLGYFLIL